MTALEAVASFVPARRVPVADLRERLGVSVAEMKVFQRYFGLAEVARDPDSSLADLLYEAASRLDAVREEPERIRYLLFARSLPTVSPYPMNPLHEVRERLGLRHANAFAVTQHTCSSGLLALDLAGRLLAATGDPEARALLLTGEKAFTWGAELIPRTTIMGEGAAACLVSADGGRDRLVGYTVHTWAEYDQLNMSVERAVRYREEYPNLLAAIIRDATAKAGLELSDLALILPHNVNTISWNRLCELIGYPPERVVLENVPLTGHCFCADAFINYRTAVDAGRLRPGDYYLMVAVGVGSFFSAMVFQH